MLKARKMSSETRLKMSIASKGKPKSAEHIANMRGRVWTEEQKDAARLRVTGTIHSEETKRKMSEAHKRNFAARSVKK